MRSLFLLLILLVTRPVFAQQCGDMDASGQVTVTDGVMVLRKAAGLPINGACAAPAESSLAGLIGLWNFSFTIFEEVGYGYLFQEVITDAQGLPALMGVNDDSDPVLVRRVQDIAPGVAIPEEFAMTDPNHFEHVCNFYLFDYVAGANLFFGRAFRERMDSAGNCEPDTLGPAHALRAERDEGAPHALRSGTVDDRAAVQAVLGALLGK